MNTSQQKLVEAAMNPATSQGQLEAAIAAINGGKQESGTGYLSARAACSYLTIGRTHLWKLTKSGLKCHRLGKRKLFKTADLNAFVEAMGSHE